LSVAYCPTRRAPVSDAIKPRWRSVDRPLGIRTLIATVGDADTAQANSSNQ
jgi:hypothetical protein